MPRPNFTTAQAVGLLTAGIPIIANLLHVFGVFDLSKEQQDALNDTIVWAAGFAAVLVAADAHLRAARNKAAAIDRSYGTGHLHKPHIEAQAEQQAEDAKTLAAASGSWPTASPETWTGAPVSAPVKPAAKPRTRSRKKG